MEGKEPLENAERRELNEEEIAQVTGGHSHPRTTVFLKPVLGRGSVICDACGLEFPDPAAYAAHKCKGRDHDAF